MNNFKKLFHLSAKNVFSHKWLYARMAIAFACITFLICLFSTFSVSLAVTQKEMKNDYVSANYIISREEIPELNEKCESFTVDEYALSSLIYKEFDYFTGSILAIHIDLEVDGREYKSIDCNDWYFNGVDIFAGEKFASKNDLTELNRRFNGVPLITGRMPQTSYEAVVCEQFLNWYGLTGDDVLGKKISLTFAAYEDAPFSSFKFLQDITVCGILCKEYFELEGHSFYLQPSIFLKDEIALLEGEQYTYTDYYYSLSGWITEEEGDYYEEKYSDFNCRYVGGWVLSDIQIIKDMQHIATNLFLIVGLTLGCGILLMVFLMTEKLIAVFSRDCGILLSCGMSEKQTKTLLFTILLWVCLFALILAAILTGVGLFIILTVAESFTGLAVSISFGVVAAAFAVAVAAVFLLAIAFYLYALLILKKRSVREHLNVQLN